MSVQETNDLVVLEVTQNYWVFVLQVKLIKLGKFFLNQCVSFLLWPFLNKHCAYVTNIKTYGMNPTAGILALFVVSSILWELVLCNVVDWYHVSMRHQHVDRKVQNLSIEAEILGYALVSHPTPFFSMLLDCGCAKTYTISPVMSHISNFKLKVFEFGVMCHLFRILDKFEHELIKVSLNIYALKHGVQILVD